MDIGRRVMGSLYFVRTACIKYRLRYFNSQFKIHNFQLSLFDHAVRNRILTCEISDRNKCSEFHRVQTSLLRALERSPAMRDKLGEKITIESRSQKFGDRMEKGEAL